LKKWILYMTGEPAFKASCAPVYQLSSEKWCSHYASFPAVFNSLSTSTNQEKQLCNQSSQYEKYGQFSTTKGSHHVQPPNQHFSLSAKMNGTQRKGLISPWRMHCSMSKGTSQAKVVSNSEARSLNHCRVTLHGLKASVSQSDG